MFAIPEALFKDEQSRLTWMAYAMLMAAVPTVSTLLLIKAPYGRYSSSAFGPGVPARLAWFIQELPSVAMPIYLMRFTDAPRLHDGTNCALLAMFLLHYIQRTFLFPLLIRGGKPIPMIPFFVACMFCMYNAYLQGFSLMHTTKYPQQWLHSPTFITGVLLFVFGMGINIHSDHILRNLREPGETGYKIPYGGMFSYVSGANFLGEIMEWSGYAVASWSLPATAFAIFTISNIGPRAYAHHKWYKDKFRDDYPKNRKALIPYVL